MEPQFTLLRPEDYVKTTWAGGVTTQLAISPAGADYGARDFLWRVSSATVSLDESDFTALPGYRRFISTLQGDMHIYLTRFASENPGYYKKLLTDASKTLFVYGGVSALAGYETVNWGKTLLSDGATLQDRDAFIYGGALTLNIEVYLSDRLALTGNVRERCLWGNDTGLFHAQYGIGLKIIIN